jgi:hypothetical protein
MKVDQNQNLIPLMFRPLRLVLSSERLRSVRIVLLKGTHFPIVGLIWLFEQLTESRERESKALSFNGPQATVSSRRLAVNKPHLLMASPIIQDSNRPHSRVRLTTPDAQLQAAVLKLSTQVENLTAIVSQLKRDSNSASEGPALK